MRITRFVRREVMNRVVEWAVESQQVARRNALVSSTEMAERRREHAEVEEFLAAHQLAFEARRANARRSVESVAG